MRTSRSLRALGLGLVLVLALARCAGDGRGAGDGSGAGDSAPPADDIAAAEGDGRPSDATPSPPDVVGAPDAVEAPSVAAMREPGPYAVGVTSLPLVDESRPVMANGDYAGAPVRELPTEVWYPAAPGPELAPGENRDVPAAADGSFPLVVYNHGFMTRPRDNAGLNAWLASHGYVVAAPMFPLTNMFAPGGANAADVTNQPDDVRFVVAEVLARAGDPAHPLHGATDGAPLGLLGVSLGGMTCLLGAFHEDYAHDGVAADAVAVMAPPGCFLPDDFLAERTVPLLVVHGDMDVILRYDENGPRTYELAGEGAGADVARYLLTLHGGTHTGFADAAAPFMDALDHPDTIGCSAIGGNPTATVEALAPLVLSFGGDDYETLRARCHSPCEGVGELPPAGKATVQAELMFVAVRAFLAASLRGDEAAHRFLVESLPAERPAQVTVASDGAPASASIAGP